MTKRISVLGGRASLQASIIAALAATGSQFELVDYQKQLARKILKGSGCADVKMPVNSYQKKQRKRKLKRKGVK